MTSENAERREITLDELAQAQKAGVDIADIQVSGMIKVIDQDGKLKAELPITRIDHAD